MTRNRVWLWNGIVFCVAASGLRQGGLHPANSQEI